MVTIVDGMNVIGANPDGWWRDRPAARIALVDAIAKWCASSGTDEQGFMVVFDGRPTDSERVSTGARRIGVRYAPGGPGAADDVIVEITAAAQTGEVAVVTSDVALAQRVRHAGAAVEGSTAFRTRLGLPVRHAGRSR